MLITSRYNPRVKELASLKDKKGRRERGTFLVEGDKMVRECMACGMEVVRIAVLAAGERPTCGDSDLYRAKVGEEGFLLLGNEAFYAISDEKTPQGILAEVRIPQTELKPPEKCSILLDGVSDPKNVGAIIRTAAAAGYGEMYLIDCADPYAPKSVRASMSGVFHMKIMRGSREEVLSALSGVPILAADMGGENIFDFVPPEKFCLAIGNEGNGLSEEVGAAAQRVIGIPMDGCMESLNAAVSAGIIMYLLRKNKF